MSAIIPLDQVSDDLIEALLDRAFEPERHKRTAYKVREGTAWLPGLSFAALDQDDFERVARVGAERDRLVAALDRYRPVDFRPEDRAMLEQVGALDQRIVASARASLDRANQELRTLFRGQGALQRYRQRGQAAIQALSRLDLEG